MTLNIGQVLGCDTATSDLAGIAFDDLAKYVDDLLDNLTASRRDVAEAWEDGRAREAALQRGADLCTELGSAQPALTGIASALRDFAADARSIATHLRALIGEATGAGFDVADDGTVSFTTIDEGMTVTEAARTMAAEKVSCRRGDPIRRTHGDPHPERHLMRVILLQRNPTRTPVGEVMSAPILPIPPDYPVFAASRAMDKMRVHRLVVTEAGHVRGIVSQTDILHAVERRLAEEERHWLLLVCSDVPMFMLDATGVVTYANVAFLRLFDWRNHTKSWSDAYCRKRVSGAVRKTENASWPCLRGASQICSNSSADRRRQTTAYRRAPGSHKGHRRRHHWLARRGVACGGARMRKKAPCHNSRGNTPGYVTPNLSTCTTGRQSQSGSAAVVRCIKALPTARTDRGFRHRLVVCILGDPRARRHGNMQGPGPMPLCDSALRRGVAEHL